MWNVKDKSVFTPIDTNIGRLYEIRLSQFYSLYILQPLLISGLFLDI